MGRPGLNVARRLRLSFADAAVFREEYERNIVSGGAFVRTAQEFEARELVEIQLDLGFCGESVVLEAEVVHAVHGDVAGPALEAGVAVQFLEPAPVLRESLQRFMGGSGVAGAGAADAREAAFFGEDDISALRLEETPGESQASKPGETPFFDPSEVEFGKSGDQEDEPFPAAVERRRAPRIESRVEARVDARSISLEGRTRNLSRSGALISADATGLPVGTPVGLELVHPVSGERLEIEGTVSRHVETKGAVAAVGIEFGPEGAGDGLNAFLGEVSDAEKERRRTGIYGAIEELGIAALVRMFSGNARRGTLTIVSGVEDGSIGFESGMLRHARLGELRGVKALSRLLSWERGRFEFHARLDPAPGEPETVALEEAIQQAIRQREELIRTDFTGILDPAACFAIDQEALRRESSLTKTQEAVLDLVAARFSVRRILDVIPQPDAEVMEALKSLLDAEVIRPV